MTTSMQQHGNAATTCCRTLVAFLALLALPFVTSAARTAPWPKEKAWAWYNQQSWIRGVNYVPSDCLNFVDQWQAFCWEEHLKTADRELALAAETGFNTVRLFLSYEVWLYEREGFLKRFDDYLALCARHGLRAIVVVHNDCAPAKESFFLKKMGDQRTVYREQKIRSRSAHTGGKTVGYNILDIPEHTDNLLAMATGIVSLHAHDPRVLFWNVMNEPGYNHHGTVAAPVLKRMFEALWKVDPEQPLAADLFATLGRGKDNPAERVARDCSDITSYHCYRDFSFQVERINYLRRNVGRPLINTEWMNRITHNRFQECYPLFYLERIGSVSWGLVRKSDHPSSSDPWPSLWAKYDAGKGDDIDLTQWMHDLYRPSLRPYDPREVALIKRVNAWADEEGMSIQWKKAK